MKKFIPDNVYQLAFYKGLYGNQISEEENEIIDFLGKLPEQTYEKIGYKLGELTGYKYTVEKRTKGELDRGAFFYTNSKSDLSTILRGSGATKIFGWVNQIERKQDKKNPKIVNITESSINASFSGKPLSTKNKKGDEFIIFENKKKKTDYTFKTQIKDQKTKNLKDISVNVRGFNKDLIFGELREK